MGIFSWHSLGPLVTSERVVAAKSIHSDCPAPIMKRLYPTGSDFFKDDDTSRVPQAQRIDVKENLLF